LPKLNGYFENKKIAKEFLLIENCKLVKFTGFAVINAMTGRS